MRLSQLFICVALMHSAVPSVAVVSDASAAENQSTPPPRGEDSGRDCEHEKKDQQVS